MLSSIRRLDVDPLKLFALGLTASALTGVVVGLLVGDLLGQATPELEIVCAGLAFYVVVSTPRRVMDARRLPQSKEAAFLATVSAASARVVGSRNRVIFMLRSADEEVSQALTDVRKALCLGTGVVQATEVGSTRLASYSAANAFQRIGLPTSTVSEGGEETRGLEASGQMSGETKFPVFMTVTFFTPIMLLLYAVFSHFTSPQRMVELVALEVVILDFALYICS